MSVSKRLENTQHEGTVVGMGAECCGCMILLVGVDLSLVLLSW